MGEGWIVFPVSGLWRPGRPGKSTLTADAAEQAVLRPLEIGAARRGGPGDPRPAPGRALLTLAGRHAGAIAAAILSDGTRHDGGPGDGGMLGRRGAEIARRGGPAIAPRWLAHPLRQGVRVDALHGSRALLSGNGPVGCGFVFGLFARPHGRWPGWVSASRSSPFAFALNAHPFGPGYLWVSSDRGSLLSFALAVRLGLSEAALRR